MSVILANAGRLSTRVDRGFNADKAPLNSEALISKMSGPQDLEQLREFTFEQSWLSLEGGKLQLRLVRPIRLRPLQDGMTIHVIDWDIALDTDDLGRLPEALARRFLELFSAAELQKLTEQEASSYLRISDYVDFQQFSVDRAPPRYLEGTVLNDSGGNKLIEWHDGSRENVSGALERTLGALVKGDRFAVWAKLDRSDRIVSAERLTLLPPIDDSVEIQSRASG